MSSGPEGFDRIDAWFESADGSQKRGISLALDDYHARVAAGQWPLFAGKARVELGEALGPGFRQVSATLNGEPLEAGLMDPAA